MKATATSDTRSSIHDRINIVCECEYYASFIVVFLMLWEPKANRWSHSFRAASLYVCSLLVCVCTLYTFPSSFIRSIHSPILLHDFNHSSDWTRRKKSHVHDSFVRTYSPVTQPFYTQQTLTMRAHSHTQANSSKQTHSCSSSCTVNSQTHTYANVCPAFFRLI